MSNNLKISYDAPSDTLYMDLSEPYEQQDSKSIAEGVLARLNPESSVVETLEILNFTKRFAQESPLNLPITGAFVSENQTGSNHQLNFTDREMQVLQLVAQGRSNRAIANELGPDEKSVKKLVGSVLRKLDLGDAAEAVTKAKHT